MQQPKYPRISFAYAKFENQKHPIYASSWVYTADYHDALHRHDFPQIWYCRRGACIHYIEDTAYPSQEGSLAVIPAGTLHTFRIPEGQETELMVVHINASFLLDASLEQYPNAITNLFLPCFAADGGWDFSPCCQLSACSMEIVSHCLSKIALSGYNTCLPDQTQILARELEEIFSLPEFCIPPSTFPKNQSLLQTRVLPIYRASQYVNRHFPEKISEESILQAGGISRSGFYRYFKRVFGCAYSQYLQQLRVDHVYVYLKYTNYPLSYIADACGFFDMQYMSQVFSRYIEESPNRRRVHLRRLYGNAPKE